MSSVKATIMLPTTGERGPLLPYSIASIQHQTIENIEIFIMGDGVNEETKKIIQKLRNEDSRIHFFDHPKHERRGEPYRHQALQQANGEIVCYLCDRDLMLPNHVETMLELLAEYNFASTTFIDVKEDQSLNIYQYILYYGPASENDPKLVESGRISLSNAAHTLAMYHKLPYGWRTTPEGQFTDQYMWKQFMEHPECNAFSHTEPTTLYFGRGHYPGASVAERKKELVAWFPKLKDYNSIEKIKEEAFRGLLLQRLQLLRFKRKHRHPLLIKGYKPNELVSKLLQKVSNLLKRL